MPRKLSLTHPVYYKIKEFLIPFLNICNVIDRAIRGCKDGGECEELKKIKNNEDEFNKKAKEKILKKLSPIYLWFLSKTLVCYCLPDAYLVMDYLNQVEFKALGNNESRCRFKSYDNYKDELIEKGSIPELYNNSNEDKHKLAFSKFKRDYDTRPDSEKNKDLIFEIACLYNIQRFTTSTRDYIKTATYLRKMIAIASNSLYDGPDNKITNVSDNVLLEWIRYETSQEYLIPSDWKLEGGKFISNFDSRIKYLGNGYLDPVNMFNQIKGLFIRWIINYYTNNINIDYSYIGNPSYTSHYSKTNSFHVCKVCDKVFIGKSTSEYCSSACRQRISRKVNRY